MRPVVISAPFGNYVRWPHASSTLGTFTLSSRGGLAYRLWRCALTLRYRIGVGWVNRLGLPNDGIMSLDLTANYSDKIISIKGFDQTSWLGLVARLAAFHCLGAVELNHSCPNIGADDPLCGLVAVRPLLGLGVTVVAKLPPIGWEPITEQFWDAGVRWFHCCNTLPVRGGGLSGQKALNLSVVRGLKRMLPAAQVIGGGGIYSQADADEYRDAGAGVVAIASALFNPFRWPTLRRIR